MRKITEETKRKISEAHKKSPLAIIAREKLRLSKIGKKRDPITTQKMAKTQFKKGGKPWNKGKKTGHTPWNKGLKGTFKHSEEHKKKISLINKGKKWPDRKPFTLETRKKLSEVHKGEKHYNWKGGVSSINSSIRRSLEYRLWRESVFQRDNWTCVWCKNRSSSGNKVTLHADHIKPFAYYPELRFAIDNGRTLCVECHKSTDTYGHKAKNHEKTRS